MMKRYILILMILLGIGVTNGNNANKTNVRRGNTGVISYSIAIPSSLESRNDTLYNYIKRTKPMIAINNNNISSINIDNSLMTTVYYDGFGRKLQTVNHRAASKETNDDLVDYIEYDRQGKPISQWLPVPTTNEGIITQLSEMSSIGQAIYNDAAPYKSVVYDNTVWHRPIVAVGEGEAWKSNQGVVTNYKHNNTQQYFTCVHYAIDTSTGLLKKKGNYGTSVLDVIETIDEDGGVVYQFNNNHGKPVLRRDHNGEFLDTYYVYDVYGNLRYVLPPELSEKLSSRSNGDIPQTDDEINKYAFIYTYDQKNRCITKKMPGASSVEYVYDHDDLLVYTQDGVQRTKSEYTYFTYDDLGRMTYSGTVIDRSGIDYLRQKYDNHSVRTSFIGYGSQYGYSGHISYVKKEDIKIVNYYDSYTFLSVYPVFKNGLTYVAKSGYDPKYISARGQLTGTMVRMLDSSGKVLVKAMYYDDRGQVVQSRESNHVGGYDSYYFKYSFTGKVLESRHENSTSLYSGDEEYQYTYDRLDRLETTKHKWGGMERIISKHNYDFLGRISNTALNGIYGVGFSYNIRGWLSGISSNRFTQSLRYHTRNNGEYGCFDGNISEVEWFTTNKDIDVNSMQTVRCSYSYYYDNIDRLIEANYSEKSRLAVPGNLFGKKADYSTSYQYDLNGNITSLNRKGILLREQASIGPIIDKPMKIDSLQHDFNENITLPNNNGVLLRGRASMASFMNEYGTIDSLQYTYNGNQAVKIDDNADDPNVESSPDFRDNVILAVEYEYDANGNMVVDRNKRITSIEYNWLNLPQFIRFESGHEIEYSYDAAGVKRSTIYRVQPETVFSTEVQSGATAEPLVVDSRKDICGSHIFNREGALTTVITENGYIDSGKWHFYIKDYQGNNRVVIDQGGVVKQVNHYYPYGGVFNESRAQNQQQYKYGGKELDRMNGLYLYDFAARWQDPARGVFTTIDPLAEKMPNISPYAYCHGNPINMIDPDGQFAFLIPATPYIIEGAIIGVGSIITLITAVEFINDIKENTPSVDSSLSAPTPNNITDESSNNDSNNNEDKKDKKKTKNQDKKDARKKQKSEKRNQPASEKRVKDYARDLRDNRGHDAKRRGHDSKGKGEPDRTIEQVKEDYDPQNHKESWGRIDRGR